MAARFVVDLGSTKLTAEQSKRIERSMQQAVLKEIASLDSGAAPSAWIFKLPTMWRGLILDSASQFKNLDKLEVEINKRLLL